MKQKYNYKQLIILKPKYNINTFKDNLKSNKKFEHGVFIKKVLEYTYNPYKQYHLTSKTLIKFINNLAAGAAAAGVGRSFDFIVCLEAGDSLRGTSASGGADDFLNVSTRQLADLSGNLINPA